MLVRTADEPVHFFRLGTGAKVRHIISDKKTAVPRSRSHGRERKSTRGRPSSRRTRPTRLRISLSRRASACSKLLALECPQHPTPQEVCVASLPPSWLARLAQSTIRLRMLSPRAYGMRLKEKDRGKPGREGRNSGRASKTGCRSSTRGSSTSSFLRARSRYGEAREVWRWPLGQGRMGERNSTTEGR